MNVLIENYRGHEIYFVTDSERFSFQLDEGYWSQKQSYAACKTKIDEYEKSNQTFKPFYIRQHSTNSQKQKVIGIRKDGRFATELPGGKKDQISEYEEKSWILYNEENDSKYAAIALLELELDAARKKVLDAYKSIETTTLSEFKKTLKL